MDPAYPYALPAGTVIGGFKLVRVIGAGGFGITYEAVSPFTGRRWAVKEFFPQGYASRADATRVVYSANAGDIIDRALTQFERSTMKLCELDHPNIVKVIHYIQENATGYMVMDYVEGRTLGDWLRDRPSPPASAELRPIMDQVFDALEYAHACNTIHRDVAPDNILIRNDGTPILIDFGALKEINLKTPARVSTLVVGKPHYSSPDQLQRGSDVRPAMDVYSTAAVLYRAVTGSPPIDADDRTSAIAHKQGDPYVALGRLRDVPLPRAMLRAIDRALSFHAADRPQTMRAFRDSLDWGKASVSATEPTRLQVGEGAPQDKPARGISRGRAAAIAGGVAAVVVLAAAYLLAPRMPDSSCSAPQLETATAAGESGLARFLKACTGGPQAAEARQRLDARIDERESKLASDAGYDVGKLRAYLTACSRCSVGAEVKARIALIEQEDKTYQAAKGSLERLTAYVAQCKACLHKDDAQREIQQAQTTAKTKAQRARQAQADDSAYVAAKGSIERLDNYLKTCVLCTHRAEAQRELDALRKAQQAALAKAEAEAKAKAEAAAKKAEAEAQQKRPPPVPAGPPVSFAGKTITLSVGFSPGGTYDLYARLVARYIGRHLAGNPTVIVQNMPGGASALVGNFLVKKAPSDGTAIGMLSESIVADQYLAGAKANFDPKAFNWIGRAASTTEGLFVWHTVAAKSIEDARTREIVLGSTSAATSSVLLPRLLNAVAGTKFKTILGYPGGNDINLAMERGEVEGRVVALDSLAATRAEWLRDQNVRALVVFAGERDPQHASVPSVLELGQTDEDRQLIRLFTIGGDIGRSLVGPPNLPPNVVGALRRALDATLADPALLQDAKRLLLEIKPLPGEGLQEAVAAIAKLPPSVIARAKAMANQ